MTPKLITIHCSDTVDSDYMVDAKVIKSWHIARGFKDIGYHAVIRRSGELEHGRGLNEIGAHVEGHNEGNIGVCLVGRSQFTKKQFEVLRGYLDGLLMNYPIPRWAIHTHNQFNPNKTCPNMEINRLIYWYLFQDDKAIQPYLFYEGSV